MWFIVIFAVIIFAMVMKGFTEYTKLKVQKKKYDKSGQLKRYTQLSLGMPEAEMLVIMGEGYSKALLEDGVVEYLWTLGGSFSVENTSVGYGDSVAHIEATKEKAVEVRVKDGVVTQVKPHNM